MYAIKRAWGKRWVRWVTMLILFVASGLSYPVFFRAIGQTFGFLDKIWVGFCLAGLILAHEWFHLRAMREHGIEGVGPIPIPFLGAWVDAKEPFPSLWSKFAVVLRGPLMGVFAVPIFIVSFYMGSPDLAALAVLWLLINAANLLPLFPFDGGLVVAAILGSISVQLANIFVVLSLVAPLAAAYYWRTPGVAIVSLLAVVELVVGRLLKKGEASKPAKMTSRQVAIAVGSYLGACAVMAAAYFVISRWPPL